MDLRTVQYYDHNADDVFTQHSTGKSGIEKYFALAFPHGTEILDIGTGSGRDTDTLIREEYEAYGVEPSRRLRELALENFPRLSGRIYSGAIPGAAADINRQFDGILCSAVFQHIPRELQFDAAFDIRNLLKPNGIGD
jgi:2-polyprenyl-3-methyl-5-hydroxy-6-metoxy-1,4-benzoquinol methylase